MTGQTVGVIGAGNMGRSVVRRCVVAGHDVLLAARRPGQAEDAARAIAAEADDQAGSARAVSAQEAVTADLVVLALWHPHTVDVATAHADALDGKIVIDIANPLDETFTGLTLPPTTSAAEELARAVPGARVVKALNTITATTLGGEGIDGAALDTFVASDDREAKTAVVDLLTGLGLRALDGGVLANSRFLERMSAFGIELSLRYATGEAFGFKFLPQSGVGPAA